MKHISWKPISFLFMITLGIWATLSASTAHAQEDPEEMGKQEPLLVNIPKSVVRDDVLPDPDIKGFFTEGLARERKNKRWGFVDEAGQVVVQHLYDWAYPFSQGLAAVSFMGRWGFIDRTGKTIIPFRYNDAYSLESGLARVRIGDQWGQINIQGKEITKFAYDWIGAIHDGLVPVLKQGKWGVLDSSGREILKTTQECSPEFIHGFILFRCEGKTIVYTGKGVKTDLAALERFKAPWTYRTSLVKSKVGILDSTGKELVAPLYDDAEILSDGAHTLFVMSDGPNMVLVDTTGKILRRVPFTQWRKFNDFVLFFKSGNRWGWVDASGREESPVFDNIYLEEFGLPHQWNGRFAIVSSNQRMGVLDARGRELVSRKYDTIKILNHGFFLVSFAGRRGVLNSLGGEVIPLVFDEIEDKGLLLFLRRGSRWGMAMSSGRLLVEPRFDGVLPGDGNFLGVKVGSKWGLLQPSGEMVVNPIYDQLVSLNTQGSQTLLKVRIGKQWGLLHRSGKTILPVQYDEITDFKDGVARILTKGKWGFVDPTGKVVVTPAYDEAGEFSRGQARVRRGNDWFHIDLQGKIQ